MTNDPQPAPIGADTALALLVAAVEAETDQSWECNSYHPSLWSALDVARAALASAAQPPAGWREALEFYAQGRHFGLSDESAWDTVSGEPQNFWCDEAGTATIEDGTVAAMALRGTPLTDEEETAPKAAPQPAAQQGDSKSPAARRAGSSPAPGTTRYSAIELVAVFRIFSPTVSAKRSISA